MSGLENKVCELQQQVTTLVIEVAAKDKALQVCREELAKALEHQAPRGTATRHDTATIFCDLGNRNSAGSIRHSLAASINALEKIQEVYIDLIQPRLKKIHGGYKYFYFLA